MKLMPGHQFSSARSKMSTSVKVNLPILIAELSLLVMDPCRLIGFTMTNPFKLDPEFTPSVILDLLLWTLIGPSREILVSTHVELPTDTELQNQQQIWLFLAKK